MSRSRPKRPPVSRYGRRYDRPVPTAANERTEAEKADDRIVYALTCERSERRYLESLRAKEAV